MDFPTKRIHVSFLAALLATATTTGCASMAKYDDGPAAPFAATAADLGMLTHSISGKPVDEPADAFDFLYTPLMLPSSSSTCPSPSPPISSRSPTTYATSPHQTRATNPTPPTPSRVSARRAPQSAREPYSPRLGATLPRSFVPSGLAISNRHSAPAPSASGAVTTMS